MPILHSVIMTVMMEVMRLLSWSAPADTSELRPVVSRGLLLLAVTLPVATGSTVSTFASLADLSGAGRADCLFVGGRDDLGGEVEPDKERNRLEGDGTERKSRRTIPGDTQPSGVKT
jgi:hypothetical protein